ncbi:helix-turn-helix domain-containing protein [Streptomyces sp. Qhu-G9]|uniref:ArsR/SmtB family transcription factor n=1 Tax=Streptomyces sp. Qhu-G9 TaxID=3452799 RepID=UPI0022AC39BA|nr:helix-turn-helix domain-containing protein [Streptomyces aurantiacus]WAU83118.1 helix-turn-helix domain-containing protein [Streptomyces aurantiacus]
MLRVHFTSDDLARVRVATGPDPLWELTNSFQSLAAGARGVPGLAAWRRQVRVGLPPACAPLAVLLPPRGYSPDFLTPDLRGVSEFESALDTVLGTSRDRLRTDLSTLAAERQRPLPAGARALAEGKTGALRGLGAALRAYHRHALVPVWAHLRAHVEADLALRARAMMEGGAEGLLSGFKPVLRWQSPVLEADYPVEREIRLGGRGLQLQPTFFCFRTPVTLADSDLTPTLAYPLQHALGEPAPAGSPESLGALIGRTRAAMLEAVVTGRTTSELAGRCGISRPAASQHTAVLREAGLLLSVRRGKLVLHTITPAGLALLKSVPGQRRTDQPDRRDA